MLVLTGVFKFLFCFLVLLVTEFSAFRALACKSFFCGFRIDLFSFAFDGFADASLFLLVSGIVIDGLEALTLET